MRCVVGGLPWQTQQLIARLAGPLHFSRRRERRKCTLTGLRQIRSPLALAVQPPMIRLSTLLLVLTWPESPHYFSTAPSPLPFGSLPCPRGAELQGNGPNKPSGQRRAEQSRVGSQQNREAQNRYRPTDGRLRLARSNASRIRCCTAPRQRRAQSNRISSRQRAIQSAAEAVFLCPVPNNRIPHCSSSFCWRACPGCLSPPGRSPLRALV